MSLQISKNQEIKLQYSKLPKYKLIEYINEKLESPMKGLNSKNKSDIISFIINSKMKIEPLEYFDKFTRQKSSVNFQKRYGLNPYTKEELLKMDFEKDNFRNPYEGTQNILNPDSQILKLEEHQKKFLNGFLIGNLRGAIVFHGVGTGKTLTAVACSNMYLQLYPKNNVYVITPSAVIYNFTKEMLSFGLDPRDPRYKYFTYEKFARSKSTIAENALLIVDEAHNFRTEMKRNKDGEFGWQNKRGQELLVRGGIPCHKCLMLTATPFVNKPYDIENLLAVAEGRYPNDEESFGFIASSSGMRYDYLKYRISKYQKSLENEYFPKKIEKFVPLIVPDDNYEIKAKTGRDNPYYVYTRQNGLDKLKFDFIMDKIKRNNNKYVCYTSFQDSGIKELEQLLTKSKISYGIISGSQNTRQKADFIDGYNNYNNEKYLDKKYRILLITKAGAEGVDLKETRGIFVMDGQWNDALYEQIVARAIRFKSHFNLPKKDQFVEVYKLFLCYKSESEILNDINDNKKINFLALLEVILKNREKEKKLKQATKDKLSKKDELEFNKAILDKYKGNKDFDPDELKKLKKGSTERAKYLKENHQFARNKESYITDEVKNLGKTTPSTDFYMFIKTKVKSYVIDKFIESISKIPKVESSISDIPEVKKIFEDIVNKKMTGKEMMNYISKILRPIIKKSQTYLSKINNLQMEKYLQEHAIKKENIRNKLKVKVGQEYFTPPHVIKEMFNFFDLKRILKNIADTATFDILEPSAGHGAVVKGIIEYFEVIKATYTIDMVEYSDENRKILEEIVLNDFIELKKTKDFLEFFPSKQYDFVFMNPPFHLDTKFNKQYKTDVYDYDFVKRAYACLNLNGVLVAITGMKWKENEEIKKWYKSKNAIIEEKTFNWSGEGLKKGAEIKNLKVSFIKITKVKEDPKEDKDILDTSFKNIIISEAQQTKMLEITNAFDKLADVEEEEENNKPYHERKSTLAIRRR